MPINVLSPRLYHFIKIMPDKTTNVYIHKPSFVCKLAGGMSNLEEKHKKFKTYRLVIFCRILGTYVFFILFFLLLKLNIGS